MDELDFNRLTDFHVHVGQFREIYYNPHSIASLILDKTGIGKIAVSSTSAGDPVYDPGKILNEIAQLFKQYGKRIIHFFWVHPEFLPDDYFWRSLKIPVHGLKVHQQLFNWQKNPNSLERVFNIAQERNLPLLIHTGYDSICSAGKYKSLIAKYQSVNITLAHGRPINEALSCLEECSNAWIDTSFMSDTDLEILIKRGFQDKIIFGTDFPITTLFDDTINSDIEHYRLLLKQKYVKFGDEQFYKWAAINPEKFLKNN